MTSVSAKLAYGLAPESDANAREWIASHDAKFGHFIDGRMLAQSGARLVTNEPSTGAKLAQVSQGSEADVAKALKAAKKAQPGWYAAGGHARAKALYALARMVQRNARLLAVLETLDNGKPIRETRDIDIPLVARHFYHHAGWAQLQSQQFGDLDPYGVVGAIVPWNFPLLMLSWKVAPALALGNTVVLKPAEQTPLSALLFAELAARAGLPAGVLNIVTGDGATGRHIVCSKLVDKIAFTGSTDVGRAIRRSTAGSGKGLTLELGGKSPFIVFDDADLDAAVEGIVDGVWFNQGQVCCAGTRLLVQESIAATMQRKLVARLKTMRVGDPLDKNTDVGAIISPEQHKRISSMVATGVSDGGKLFQAQTHGQKKGCYYPPTLLADIPTTSEAAVEEIFGPVLVSMPFRTSDEAVMLANNSRYGLAASVYSENLGLALEVAPRLASGVVWVNSTNLFDAAVGFGGYRESGFGREGGREGALEYLKPRNLFGALRKPSSSRKLSGTAGPQGRSIDRTAKNFIGGKQKRPDGGYSYAVIGGKGDFLGEAAAGNRKDIRDAVAAARSNSSWSNLALHSRAQIMYYWAENLDARGDEFARRLREMTGASSAEAKREVALSVERLFTFAAWCDKHEGWIHEPPVHGVALAMNEPLGVVGLVCPQEAPLLAFISLAAPLLAAGNRVVALPSARHPFAATDLYQVLETSDFPAGALNIVTGEHASLLPTLASHLDVDSIWVFGSKAESAQAELLSSENLKRTFVDQGRVFDWSAPDGHATELLQRAVQVKNIWIPYGD